MSDAGDGNEQNDPKPESQSEADEHTEQAVQQTQWQGDPQAESQSEADEHTEQAVQQTQWQGDPKPESQSEADQHTEQAVAATQWQGDPTPMSAASADQIVQTAVNQTQWLNVGTGIRLNSNPGISVFFTVSLDVVDLGMWSKMSGLGMTIATTDRPDTAMSFFQHHLPGHMTYSNIVLERPVSVGHRHGHELGQCLPHAPSPHCCPDPVHRPERLGGDELGSPWRHSRQLEGAVHGRLCQQRGHRGADAGPHGIHVGPKEKIMSSVSGAGMAASAVSAYIQPINPPMPPITFAYNPEGFTIVTEGKWKDSPQPATNGSQPQWQGVAPPKLEVKILWTPSRCHLSRRPSSSTS